MQVIEKEFHDSIENTLNTFKKTPKFTKIRKDLFLNLVGQQKNLNREFGEQVMFEDTKGYRFESFSQLERNIDLYFTL